MPQDTQNKQGTLARLLAQELESLRSFVVLLGHEQELLTQGAAEPLAVLATEKSAMATGLALLASERASELMALGLPTDRAGMENWLGSQAGSAHRAHWNELLLLAGQARALNETNGKLIGIHMQNNQQALNILMAAVDQTVTYGPDGQQKAGSGGRSLGSA